MAPSRRPRPAVPPYTAIAVSVTAAALLSVGSIALVHAQRPAAPRTGLAVYEDINYGGRSRVFTLDVDNLRSSGLNDRISSLIVAPGETWEVCTDPDYRGRCTLVSGADANLVSAGWNDRISSIRRVRSGGGFPGFPGGRGGGIGGRTLEVFSGTNYTGQRRDITEAVVDFRSIDFNDRAASVRLRGGGSWEICVNADYDDCRLVDENVPDLAAIGLRRLVSSARPRFGRGGGGGGGGEPADRITLYDRTNFGGTAISLSSSRPSLGSFNDRAESVRVANGRWELCDEQKYGGRCVVVTNDVRDLRVLGLHNRIESVRER